ncbi:MAG: DUF2854 domain-containing protein [Cyanobacteria bacterium P01_D01_bin.123]
MFSRLPVPLSVIVLVLGVAGTIWGFVEYNNPTANLIGLSIGLPLLLGGAVMKAVELKPVPPLKAATDEMLLLREQQATDIQIQIREDITKYNYGADAHLDTALEHLSLKGATDAELPRIAAYNEEKTEDGRYALRLRFNTPKVPYKKWERSYEKQMAGFFGRDVEVAMTMPQKDVVDIVLTTRQPDADTKNTGTEAAESEAETAA